MDPPLHRSQPMQAAPGLGLRAQVRLTDVACEPIDALLVVDLRPAGANRRSSDQDSGSMTSLTLRWLVSGVTGTGC
jgi:hypothetical protein